MAGTHGQDINIYGADGNAINAVSNSLQTAIRDTIGNQVLAQDNQLGIINGFYKPDTVTCEWQRTPRKYFSGFNVAVATTNTTLWTPTTGKVFRLLSYSVSCSVALTTTVVLQLWDAANLITTIHGLIANTAYTYTFPGNGYRSLAANNALSITISTGTGTIAAFWNGTEE